MGTRVRVDRPLRDRSLLLIVVTLTLPIAWMGYGTDIDVANLLDAGATIRSGSYSPSRTPGSPVLEMLVAVMDPVGGHLLVNLATVAAAGALVVGLARLVRAWGHGQSDLLALAFLVSPVTIIAAAGLADFVWALGFFVWGALAHLGAWSPGGNRIREGRGATWWPSAVAGVLFALALGTRLSTGFVIAAFLVADGWDPARRPRCLRTAVVAFPLGASLFIPSWLAFNRSAGFLENAEGYRGLFTNLGLFAYKNYIAFGLALVVVLVPAAPALVRALSRWGGDPMLRFAVMTLVLTEGLFFLMPWKTAHLLPSLMALLLWLGCSAKAGQRRYLWLVVAAVAVNGIVTFRPMAPDSPDVAGGGRWDPAVTAGLLVNDVRCRRTFMAQPPTQLNVEAAWSCHLEPMRGPVETP